MLDKVKTIIGDYVAVEVSKINAESKLIEDLGMNSYEFMSLVGQIEDEFDIEVDEREVVKIKTVGEIIEYIQSLQLVN